MPKSDNTSKHVITLDGRDYPARVNLRAMRRFEDRTGQRLADLITRGWESPATLRELPIETVTALVWAFANSSLEDGPTFDEVEVALDLDALPGVVEQVVTLLADGVRGAKDPLAAVAQRLAQLIGSDSGPSASAA